MNMILNEVFVVIILAVQCLKADDSCTYPLITEFSQENCIQKGIDNENQPSYYLSQSNCLPTCLEYRYSTIMSSCSIDKEETCPRGYSCSKRCSNKDSIHIECTSNDDCPNVVRCKELCVPVEGSCMAYYANTSDFSTTYFNANKFKPQCLDDGSWATKQCKGGQTGRCMCYDALGNRIFGEAPYPKSDNMTCACSRRRADILASGVRNFVFLHCDSMGNYEPLQCDGNQCWCVESKTGELVAPVVPKAAMTYLPCYSAITVGTQYLRQCESEKYSQEVISEELKIHGVEYSNFRYLICDGDGAFGPYNVSNSRPYCTWRDGTLIAPYQGENIDTLNYIKCNCARDNKRYGMNQQCLSYGNYEPVQTIENSGQKYCVDSDGFSKSDIFDSSVTLNCSTFY